MAPHASQAKRERRNHGLDGGAENLHTGCAEGGRAILRPIQIASAGSEVACGCFSPYRGLMFNQAALNASLNGLSAVFLSSGYILIRQRRIAAHKVCMISAFSVSAAFLVSYVVYHLRVGAVHFQGQGWIRPVYFALLLTHTILAVVIVPLAIITLRRAWKGQFERHRGIARWTLPLWFYVFVTGVIIYVLLYQLYAARIG